MEILAPAGSVDHFIAAVEAGADAVYVGAPGFNARNPSKELSFAEIRAMVDYGNSQEKNVYVALNSLVREIDLPQLIDTFGHLELIEPDGLIVQDLGVIDLVASHFKQLKLHGSTLMFAHNSRSVEMLANLGCSRVVLARELTVKEIETIVRRSPVEIEVFIHGAMCFSYSGGCLFSSYHGGKSGLRGNCVQPCRRKFSVGSGKKSAYLFSMNDLEGLDFIDDFKRIGIASIKIEGRLRSVNYVDHVVRAYRLVLDADVNAMEESKKEARRLIQSALGRKSSTGYFLTSRPKDIIASHHSGNIGTFLGRFKNIKRQGADYYGTITLKQECEVGERFRLHFDRSGERVSFTAKEIRKDGRNESIFLLPANLKPQLLKTKVELYRVDVKKQKSHVSAEVEKKLKIGKISATEKKQIQAKTRRISHIFTQQNFDEGKETKQSGSGRRSKKNSAELWLRLDSIKPVFSKLPFSVDRFVFNIDKRSMADTGQLKRYFGREKSKIIWALPQVVHEQMSARLKKDIALLIRSGFRNFQITNISQLPLFEEKNISVFGDYSLNLLNSRAMALMSDFGLTGFQFCIETDKNILKKAIDGYRKSAFVADQKNKRTTTVQTQRASVGLTVYGAPPLFISRAVSDIPYNQTVSSPKGERFVITRKGSESLTRPVKPFSLLPFRKELERMGIDYMVVDLSGLGSGKREMEEMAGRIFGKGRSYKLPTFNYQGVLE